MVRDKKKWMETLESISKYLITNRIKHVFMKMLVDPFSWGDIDILIPNPLEVIRAGNILQNYGFNRGNAGKLSPALKCVFEKDEMIIEIYPEAAWKRQLVADANLIVANRVMNKTLRVYTPHNEDEFYLLATHAFSHMQITKAEIANAFRLCSQDDFDWLRIKDMAIYFGTHVSVYFFLRTLSHFDSLPTSESLKMFPSRVDAVACRLIDKWFESKSNLEFPLTVPRFFGRVFAPFHHTPALLRNGISMKEVLFDFVSSLC